MKPLFYAIAFGLTVITAACTAATPATSLPPLEVTLIATDIAFDQTEIEATAGQPIRLTLRNEGVLEHDFSITQIPYTGEVAVSMDDHTGGHDMGHMSEAPDIHVAAAQKGSSTIEFTPSEPGEYAFYCTVSGHKEAGMVGTLVVAP